MNYKIVLRDPMNVLLVGPGVAMRPVLPVSQTPIKLFPDFDVELDIPDTSITVSGKAICVHARRKEDFDLANDDGPGPVSTDRCRNPSSSVHPNGYLCQYHQRFLNPVPDRRKIYLATKGNYAVGGSGEVDAEYLKPAMCREVMEARQELADNEIHDHVTFQKLQDVQVDATIYRKYLATH